MRPPPTTLEFVEALAVRDPRRPALREDDTELTYAQFFNLAAQCALRLQQLGVRRGDRVAVSGPGFARQLILLLAAEGLGAATLSFQEEGDIDAGFLFTQVQWVFSGRAQAVPRGVRFQLVDDDFMRALAAPLGAMQVPWAPAEAHEPQRISRTSGSSGQSKFMLLPRRVQEYWVQSAATLIGLAAPRVLVLAPLVLNGAFARSSATLRLGGTVLAGRGHDIARLDPDCIWGLPLHLERLLGELPAGYVAPRPVAVLTSGGLLPAGLRERVHATFRGRIGNRYGTNECGAICADIDATGTGVLSPGIDLRIVDDQGQEVPTGHYGKLVVRTPAMVDGYLERPQESAAAFRDGWYFTSDVGALVGRRTLRLAGRHDDLMNVGGLKVPAAQLEEAIRRQPAVADCAVLAVTLDGGAVTLGVAVVLASRATAAEATPQVQAALQLGVPLAVRLLFLEQLPRLSGGKVDRMELLRLFGAASAGGG